MHFEIRPFEVSYYESVMRLVKAIYPDSQMTAEEWRNEDRIFEGNFFVRRRFVAVSSPMGDVVGFGSISHIPTPFHPQKFQIQILVHPNSQRLGIGSAIFQRSIAELKTLNAVSVQAKVREEHEEAITFLLKRGFKEIQRFWELWLDVAEVDLEKLFPTFERMKAQGINIVTLADEQRFDPDCLRKLYELQQIIGEETPLSGHFTFAPFDDFALWIERSNLLPDAFFIAKEGNEYIGISNLALMRVGERNYLYQAQTGVLAKYRRRKIATALKIAAIKYAQKNGFPFIVTHNTSESKNMLALNEKLGFKRKLGIVKMERRFSPNEHD